MDHRRTAVDPVVTNANAGCEVSEEWSGSAAVVAAVGELDVLTAPRLQAGIESAIQKNPAAVIVDLSGVDFLSSAGMAVLVAGREQAQARDIKFGVVASGPATSRPLILIGLAEVIGMHASLAEAHAALGR